MNCFVYLSFSLAVSVTGLPSADQYQYTVSRLEDICGTGSKRVVKFHYEKPRVFTFNSTVTSSFNCHLELEVSSGDGFMVYIDALQIDEEPRCLKDYVQFGWDVAFVTVELSDKKCANLPLRRYEEEITSYEYLKDTNHHLRIYEKNRREIDVWIELSPQRNKRKEIMLTVTPMKICTSSLHTSRFARCPNTNLCISKSLFCDGKINCAKNAQDEDSSNCNMDEESFLGSPIGVPIIIILSVVVPTAFVISSAFIFSLMKRYLEICRERTESEDGDSSRSRVERRRREGRQNEEARRNSSGGAVALSELLASSPHSADSAPLNGNESPPLPSSPPPYSEIYKDDPPKYSEIAPDNYEPVDK